MITLHPLDENALAPLQRMWDAQLAPHGAGTLAAELRDAARAFGRQAVLARCAGEAVGAAGWVTLGVQQDGCAYGAPLVAANEQVALALAEDVRQRAVLAGARRLRISVFAGEAHKRAALLALGFRPLFEFVHFACALPLPDAGLPDALHVAGVDAIDWPRLHACYAEVFAQVPNAPAPELAVMREEWLEGDAASTCALFDDAGACQGFVLVSNGEVEALGVRPAWRGRGVADALYAIVSRAVLAQGGKELRAMVASVNVPSMRLHQRLGFAEHAPRTEVFECPC